MESDQSESVVIVEVVDVPSGIAANRAAAPTDRLVVPAMMRIMSPLCSRSRPTARGRQYPVCRSDLTAGRRRTAVRWRHAAEASADPEQPLNAKESGLSLLVQQPEAFA